MSYNPAQTNPLDRARFLVGDTDEEAELITDDEYLAVLARHTDFRRAVIEIAHSLMSRASQELTSLGQSGGVSLGWQNLLSGWKELVRSLEAEIAAEEAATPTPAPSASAYMPVLTPVDWR